MRMTLKCAWCGSEIGLVDGNSIAEPGISHGICSGCRSKLLGAIHNKAESWDGRERRRVDDRRTRERRRSSTDEADDLMVVSGRTWIDGKRRMKVRRAADRVWLSDLILSGAFLNQSKRFPT